MTNWLDEKDRLLVELNGYISQCSGLDPIPFDYIENLHRMREQVQTANQAELPGLLEWWRAVAPKEVA